LPISQHRPGSQPWTVLKPDPLDCAWCLKRRSHRRLCGEHPLPITLDLAAHPPRVQCSLPCLLAPVVLYPQNLEGDANEIQARKFEPGNWARDWRRRLSGQL